jgi:RNA polymerase sigma factor (sigma-70 family)
MPWLREDRSRLERFRAGDPAVLGEVFRRYRGDIEGLLLYGFTFESRGETCRFKGVRNPADVEDRLHDVFVRAFAPAARLAYDGVSEYGAWLRTIARNATIDHLRSREGRLEALAVHLDAAPRDAGHDGGHRAPTLDSLLPRDAVAPAAEPWEHAEIVRVAQVFLARLDDTERAILELRYRRAVAQEEAARRLGMSAPTLRKRERALFARFLDHMRAHGYFEAWRPSPRGALRRASAAACLGAVLVAALGGPLP